jgi:hypothetical protein
MTVACAELGRVLGFHPNARGFGWVVFEGPFRPIDWGLVSARKDKNATSLKRLDRLLTRFAPEVLVLEAYDRETTRRARRIARLGVKARKLADGRGIETAVYSRAEIREAFAETGARTRREVAEAVEQRRAAVVEQVLKASPIRFLALGMHRRRVDQRLPALGIDR